MLNGKEYFYKYFEDSVKKIAGREIVVDVGTSSRYSKELLPFKEYFKDNYFALGYKPHLIFGQNNVDMDSTIYCLPFKDNSIDAVMCLSVFEHLSDPFEAAVELYRVLKSGGQAFLIIPFMLAEHSKKDGYGDYYRFTAQGIRHLFSAFSEIEIVPQGRGVFYRLYLVPQVMKLFNNRIGMKIIKFFDMKTGGNTTTAWMINLKK